MARDTSGASTPAGRGFSYSNLLSRQAPLTNLLRQPAVKAARKLAALALVSSRKLAARAAREQLAQRPARPVAHGERSRDLENH